MIPPMGKCDHDMPFDSECYECRNKVVNVENTFYDSVCQVLEETKAMLFKKNEAYGNSALDPVRIFSKADSVEQIKVRIDDKLSRLMRGTDFEDENTVDDLLGYLVLLKIARG